MRRQSIVLLVAALSAAASARADGPGLTDLIQRSSRIVSGSITNRTLLHEESLTNVSCCSWRGSKTSSLRRPC